MAFPHAHVSRRALLAGALTTASVAALGGRAAAEPTTPTAPTAPVSLGEPLQDVNLIGAAVTTTPDGVPTCYGVTVGNPATLAAVNLGTGRTIWAAPLPGAGGSYAVLVDAGGDVYVAAYSGGRLYRVRWGTRTVEDLGEPLPGQSFLWDITFGPGDRIYGVTFPGARLYAYDPATGAVRDYGPIATDTQQARTLTVHNGLLYAGTMAPAHLLEIDPATGAAREIPLPPQANPDDPQTSVFDLDVVGDVLYVRAGTDIKHAPLFPLDLATGTWRAPVDGVAGLSLSTPGPGGELYLMRANTLTAYDPATGALTETSLVYPGRVYNYRGVGWVDLGDPRWPGPTLAGCFWRGEVWRYNPATGASAVVRTDVPGSPIEVISLAPAAGGGVWAGGYLGGFARVSVEDGAADFHRWSQTECVLDDGSAVWLGAYPDARGYRYDPDAPFNDPDYAPGPPGTAVNPVKLWDFAHDYTGDRPQDRTFAFARDGRYVFAANGPKLSSFGGTLVVHDTRSGAVTIRDDVSRDRALTSLAPARGVLYAGTWVNGGTGAGTPPATTGTVLAYDVASGRVLWEVSPGGPSCVGTVVDGRGRLWTLAGTTLVRLEPHTGRVLRRITLPGTVDTAGLTFPTLAGQVTRVPGADALYVGVAGRFSRVWPASDRVEDLGAFPYRQFTVLDDGLVVMSSGATVHRWRPPRRREPNQPA